MIERGLLRAGLRVTTDPEEAQVEMLLATGAKSRSIKGMKPHYKQTYNYVEAQLELIASVLRDGGGVTELVAETAYTVVQNEGETFEDYFARSSDASTAAQNYIATTIINDFVESPAVQKVASKARETPADSNPSEESGE